MMMTLKMMMTKMMPMTIRRDQEFSVRSYSGRRSGFGALACLLWSCLLSVSQGFTSSLLIVIILLVIVIVMKASLMMFMMKASLMMIVMMIINVKDNDVD